MIRTDKKVIALLVIAVGFFIVFDYIYANTSTGQIKETDQTINTEVIIQPTVEPLEFLVVNSSEEISGEQELLADKENPEEPQFSKTIEGDVQLESILLVVNKETQLPAEYVPKDLTEVEIRFSPSASLSKRMLRQEAAEALEKLFQEAEVQNIMLYGVSGYRSYETQRGIYERKVASAGQAMADRYVAYPGKSEHQTGLAMDVTNQKGINKSLTEDFGETPEGKWLKENAHIYGFIIRYPFGKESITGYSYEPWHIRYVGESTAEFLKVNELVLEEYMTPIVTKQTGE